MVVQKFLIFAVLSIGYMTPLPNLRVNVLQGKHTSTYSELTIYEMTCGKVNQSNVSIIMTFQIILNTKLLKIIKYQFVLHIQHMKNLTLFNEL